MRLLRDTSYLEVSASLRLMETRTSGQKRPTTLFLCLWILSLGNTCVAFATQCHSVAGAQEHAQKGERFAEANDLKAAESEMRRAVDVCPDNPQYLTELGGILGMERKLEESNLLFAKALRLDPNNALIRRNLASNEWQAGHFEQAEKNLRRVLALHPGDQRAILLLGLVSESLKQYPDAVRLLESVPNLVREQPESTLALARSYYHTGSKEKARQMLNGMASLPARSRGIFLGAQAAAQAEDYETAERLLCSVKSTYPDHLALGYQLALVQYRAGHFAESRTTLRDLIAAGYHTVDIYNLLAWSYHKAGNSAKAIQAFDEAIGSIPPVLTDYLELGNVLLRSKLFPAAHAVATKAVQLDPTSDKAFRLKGYAELELQFYKDAIESYSQALRLNPASADAQLGLAAAHWGAGNNATARVTFEEGLKRFPHDAPLCTKYARFLLKLAEENLDRATESLAVSLLQRAIAIDRSQPDAHYELGNFFLAKGRVQEAVEELETAAKLDSTSSKIRYSLSRAYRGVGRDGDASKQMRAYYALRTDEDRVL